MGGCVHVELVESTIQSRRQVSLNGLKLSLAQTLGGQRENNSRPLLRSHPRPRPRVCKIIRITLWKWWAVPCNVQKYCKHSSVSPSYHEIVLNSVHQSTFYSLHIEILTRNVDRKNNGVFWVIFTSRFYQSYQTPLINKSKVNTANKLVVYV